MNKSRMKRLTQIVGIALTILISNSLYAQRDFRTQADYAYKNGQYYKAIEAYKKVLGGNCDKECKAEVHYLIGNSYKELRNYEQAEVFYDKAAQMNYDDPKVYLYLGFTKKANGKCDEAVVQFQEYLKSDPNNEMIKNQITCCKDVSDWKPTRYKVQNMALINSPGRDFSPGYGKDEKELYFTSKREGASSKPDINTGEPFSALYFTQLDKNGKWSTPQILPEPLTIEANDGQPILTDEGKTMYFTRCLVEKKKELVCHLYKSKARGKVWEEPEKLPFGTDSTWVVHPTFSKDGQTLYFASNMADGKGGFDIWKVEKKGKDEWGEPENVESLNTPGNESFPYLRDSAGVELLYFSTDYRCGLGGLDIFVAEPNEDGTGYKEPKNLRAPLNSAGDDFGIIWEGDQSRGYLSSNRMGGKGSDDIYSFVLPPLNFVVFCDTIRDIDTKEPIGGVKVEMLGSDGSSIQALTNESGSYEFELKPETSYKLTFCKKGYYTETGQVSTVGMKESAKFKVCVELKNSRLPIVLPGVEYDLDKWFLRPESKKVLDEFVKVLETNPNLVIELSSHTDYRGSDEYNKELSQKRAQSVVDYLITKGIEKERLVAKGYGEEKPRIVPPKPVKVEAVEQWNAVWGRCDYKPGDEFKEKWIDDHYKKKSDCWEDAMQKNRRTEFAVLRDDYVPKGQKKSDTGCQ